MTSGTSLISTAVPLRERSLTWHPDDSPGLGVELAVTYPGGTMGRAARLVGEVAGVGNAPAWRARRSAGRSGEQGFGHGSSDTRQPIQGALPARRSQSISGRVTCTGVTPEFCGI